MPTLTRLARLVFDLSRVRTGKAVRLFLGTLLALLIGFAAAAPAAAQSLTPLERDGLTPSASKAFRLQVGNPYQQRMVFVLIPMQPDFKTPAEGAEVTPIRVVMAPGHARTVIFAFKIDPALKERTIGLCIMPENIDGPILPRVCGLYTGRMAGGGG